MTQQDLGKHSEKNNFSCLLGSSLARTFVRIWLSKAASSSSGAELGPVDWNTDVCGVAHCLLCSNLNYTDIMGLASLKTPSQYSLL